MREIKFRGETYLGKTVYGDLTHNTYIGEEPVKPESVKQLVGYDEDGREVYEGDELEAGRYGDDGRAEMRCSIDAYDYRLGIRFENYKLKK